MTFDAALLVLAVAALVVAAPLGLYVWTIYNDLVTRRERLHALLGNALSMQARRHGIGKMITRDVHGRRGTSKTPCATPLAANGAVRTSRSTLTASPSSGTWS